MGRRSSIGSLPKEVRRWLERILTENSFIGYAELESLLREEGYNIIRSSLRWPGCKMEQQLARVRAATEAAHLFARETGDDPDDRSAGLIALVQTEMADVLMRLQEPRKNDNPLARARLLATASEDITTLTCVSVNLKRYQTEVRERVGRATTATEKIARKGGFSVEAVQALYWETLGVVSRRNRRRTFLVP